jgi:hypothetical protein
MNILLGVLLIVSPWVFGYRSAGSAAIWNSVIVGALIAHLAANNCFAQRIHTAPNWIIVLLALWTTISPLVYGYTANTGSLLDNVILAVLIAAFAICSDGAVAGGQKSRPPDSAAQ